MNLLQRLLKKILGAQISYPWLFLFGAAVLTTLSIVYTVKNIQFWTSQRDLISQDNRLMQLADQADQLSDYDTFVVAIQNDETQRSLQFVRALGPRLRADYHFSDVFWRIDPAQFKPWSLLYPTEKELLSLTENLKEHESFIRNFSRAPGLYTFFDQLNNEMAARMVGQLFTGYLERDTAQDDNPLNLQFLINVLVQMKLHLQGQTSFVSPWGSFFAGSGTIDESEEGYFWTENRKYLLLFVTPGEPGKGFSRWHDPLLRLRQIVGEAKADFPGINAGVTGKKALGEDEMNAALHDMSLATLLSLAGLAVLLVSFWGGIRKPLIEIVTLVFALSVTFGLTTLIVGHLNVLSVVFAPMLLGLGIDYGVHWFARYREELQYSGASSEEALQTTIVNLGPAILLAGITAASSFFPLALTGFKGLGELGIICGIGLIVITLATLCLLPALLVLFDKDRSRSLARSIQPVKPFLRLTRTSAVVLVAVSVIAAGFSLWQGRKVKFDLNTLQLQSKKAESVIWEKKLIKASHRSGLYGVTLAHSVEEIKKKRDALMALPPVSEVQSVLNFLPSDQGKKIALLRRMRPLVAAISPFSDEENTVDPLQIDEVLGKIRFKMVDANDTRTGLSGPVRVQMRQVLALIDDIRESLHRTDQPDLEKQLSAFENELNTDFKEKLDFLRKGVNAKPMRIEDLPKQLQERYVGRNNLYLIRVFPSEDIWQPDLLRVFVRALRSVDPDAVGEAVTLSVFTEAFRTACIKAALYGLVFILALLLATFRSPASTLLAFSPLIVGTAWTFGLMYLFKIDLNLANSIFLPLILGAGVEYGIIVVQRWRQRAENSPEGPCPSTTGVGVVLAGISTTVGFGSLTISEHQGVHSLGLLSTIGSLSVLAAAVFFLPALLQLIPDRRARNHDQRHDRKPVVASNPEKEKRG